MTYALFAGVVAAAIALVAGYPFVAYMRERKIGKAISADGPESHLSKAGTPTMGGLLIIAVGVAGAFAFAVPKDRDLLLAVAVAAVFCAIGFYDDLGTLAGREQRAAHERRSMIAKLAGFTLVAVVAAWLLYDRIDAPRLLVPQYGHYDIGAVYVLIAIAVIVSTTAALGVTDGLDMLAGSTTAVAFAAYGAIALMQDQTGVAAYCFVMVGALMGFLWFNAYPARVFMGDSGSLPLGGSLAIAALLTGWWLLLPLIGIVFVAEQVSVIVQVAYFRATGGKRFFRMAPIHHHFEEMEIPETRITVRMLLIAIAAALAGVALAGLD